MIDSRFAILVIEDDSAHRTMVRRLVTVRAGDRAMVMEAGTMEEGLLLLRTERVDLLLLDHTLPQGSSLDELRLVRAEHPDLPVVMHTGYLSPEHEVEALAGGVREVILKGPFDPLWAAIVRAIPSLAPPAPGSEPVSGAAPGRTVLVVEDDPGVLNIVERTLREAGFGVVTAVNGARALELLDTLPQAVDVVFADVRMPEMGGAELGRVLGRTRPTLPVIYTSGWPDEQSRSTSQVPRNAVFLPKPFTPDKLIEGVRTGLARAGL